MLPLVPCRWCRAVPGRGALSVLFNWKGMPVSAMAGPAYSDVGSCARDTSYNDQVKRDQAGLSDQKRSVSRRLKSGLLIRQALPAGFRRPLLERGLPLSQILPWR